MTARNIKKRVLRSFCGDVFLVFLCGVYISLSPTFFPILDSRRVDTFVVPSTSVGLAWYWPRKSAAVTSKTQFPGKHSKVKARVGVSISKLSWTSQGSGPHQLRARTMTAVKRMHTTKGMIDLQRQLGQAPHCAAVWLFSSEFTCHLQCPTDSGFFFN